MAKKTKKDLVHSPTSPVAVVATTERRLTQAQYQTLADLPPEIEWFANIKNKKTRRAYQIDLRDFMDFVGIHQPEEFRTVTRAHVLAWREDLEGEDQRHLAPSTIRRKLSALSSLFEALCDANAITHNPVKGVKRPGDGSNEGKTPALSSDQARALLHAPRIETLKGKRDTAILATLLYHGLRREELCTLKVKHLSPRSGMLHLTVRGKGSKTRYLLAHPHCITLIQDYLEAAGHGQAPDAPLFLPLNVRHGKQNKAITPDSIYTNVIKHYAHAAGVDFPGFGPHVLRATAATNALDNGADIAKVQEWLGHSSIATTRLYDRRQSRPEESPTLKVEY